MAEAVATMIGDLARKWEIPLIFVLLFCLYLSNCFYYMSSTDTIPAILLPFNILDRGTITLDNFMPYYNGTANWWGTYYFTPTHDHIVSSYPIVVPVLATPLYIPAFLLTKLMGVPIDMGNHTFFLMVYAMEKLAAGFIAALAGVVFYLLLRELFSRRVSLIGLALFALGTSTWTIGSQGLWQHGMSELLLCLILLTVVKGMKAMKTWHFILLGVLSALLVFNRPTNGLLLIPALYYALRSGLRPALAYVVSGAVVAVPFLAYSLFYFGSVFGGYSGLGASLTIDGLIPYRLAGLLASPSRGILIYTPIVILALAGLFYVKGLKEPKLRHVLYLFALAAVGTIVTYSTFPVWWGGGCYGPRFFTDIIPVIVLFVVLFINEVMGWPDGDKKKAMLAVIVILAVWSIAVQAVGAYLYPVYGFQWGHGQTITVENQSKLWDWSDTQLGESLNGIFNRSAGYNYIIENGSVKVVPSG
jgi:hypothetical protein